jgi:hypothetical protein
LITENLSTLKIHKLTKAQYERELAAGNIDPNALYLTPDEEVDLSGYVTVERTINGKALSEDIYLTADDVGVYVQAEEPVDAVDGDIWVDTDAESHSDVSSKPPYVMLSDYGAIGDGVADDTAAVKAAIVAAKEQNKHIHVAAGTYNLTDIIDVEDVELIGVSPDKCIFHIISQTTTREHFINCKNAIIIKNIQFKMSCSGKIIGLFDVDGGVFDNCIFMFEELTSEDNAVPLDLYRANNNIKFTNCQFLNYAKTNTGGIWVRNSSNTVISKNILFENCDFKHSTKDEVVAVWGWQGTVEDVIFQNCSFESMDDEFTSTHFITLGMNGVSRNLTLDNCKIYNNYANGITIKSTVADGGTIENVNINNCYFKIVEKEGNTNTNFSFESNMVGILKVNNCIIDCIGKGLFNYTIVNNNIITTDSYLADFSIIKNSNITLTGPLVVSQKSLELYNCLVDFNNQTFSSILFQPLKENSKIVLHTCEFKNINGYTANKRFLNCGANGVTIEIINSKLAYCNIYSGNKENFNLTMHGNVLTGTNNGYWGSGITENVHDNIVNGVYCMHGLKTSADDYIVALIEENVDMSSLEGLASENYVNEQIAAIQVRPTFTLEQFGGKKNDVNIDNSQALLSALTQASEVGGIVCFESGIYYFSTPVVYEGRLECVEICGTNVAFSDDTKGTTLYYTGTENFITIQRLWKCKIHDFKIHCTNPVTAITVITNSYLTQYTDLAIYGCKTCIDLQGFAYTYLNHVDLNTGAFDGACGICVGDNDADKTREYLYLDNSTIQVNNAPNSKNISVNGVIHFHMRNNDFMGGLTGLYINTTSMMMRYITLENCNFVSYKAIHVITGEVTISQLAIHDVQINYTPNVADENSRAIYIERRSYSDKLCGIVVDNLYIRHIDNSNVYDVEVDKNAIDWDYSSFSYSNNVITNINIEKPDNINVIPNYTEYDNNKFLCVVNGAVAWQSVHNAEEVAF